VLLHAIPEEMQVGLTRKDSTMQALESIWVVQMGRERIKEANADKLR
jgi:hypothetical protein